MKPLGEVLALSVQYLKDRKVSSPRLVAETLLSHVLCMQRMDLYTKFECPLKESELAIIRGFLKRASLFEPVEYITAEVDFYGLRLPVSSHVLIPRQETEILVDKAAAYIQKRPIQNKILLDVCSGSGCIGLSLKNKFPEMTVFLSDMSDLALTVSREGAARHDLDVTFLQGDLLKPFFGKKADYVFCNPPYISNKEYEELEPSVKGYEPRGALVGGETGLEFYERLSRDLPDYLNPGAQVFLEIGYEQGKEMNKIFSASYWVQKELMQDWAGKDRFFFLEIE